VAQEGERLSEINEQKRGNWEGIPKSLNRERNWDEYTPFEKNYDLLVFFRVKAGEDLKKSTRVGEKRGNMKMLDANLL